MLDCPACGRERTTHEKFCGGCGVSFAIASLPSTQSRSPHVALPSGGTPASDGDEAVPPPSASGERIGTLRDRLAAVTAGGGLTVLPAGFDDADGDWKTVASEDVFERLYLDGHQFEKITPEIVARHATLLTELWRRKLEVLSQGAAKEQIIRKYGEGNELKVRGYPARIEAARAALGSADLIAAAVEQARRRRVEAGQAKLEENLALAMADGQFVPAEAQVFFDRAGAVDLSEREVRKFLIERLTRGGFRPVAAGRPIDAIHDDPFSVVWALPSAVATADAAGNDPPKPQWSSGTRWIVGSSVVAAAVAIALAVVIGSRSAPVPDTSPVTTVAPLPPAPAAASASAPSPPEINPAPISRPSPPSASARPSENEPAGSNVRPGPSAPQASAELLAVPPPAAPVPEPVAPPAVAPAVPADQPQLPSPSPPPPEPLRGDSSGTLTYSGPPVVQNGEIVFRNLPLTRLTLMYDQDVWEARLSPGEGNTQRLILRNRKPGTQKKCVVTWRILQQ